MTNYEAKYSPVLAKATAGSKDPSKGKVIDIRGTHLFKPQPDFYKQIIGRGGKSGSPNCVFPVYICDYTVTPSVSVSFNLSVEMVLMLREAALKCSMNPNALVSADVAGAQALAQQVLQEARSLCSGGKKDEQNNVSVPYERLVNMGKSIRELSDSLAASNTVGAFGGAKGFVAEKFNTHRVNEQGRCPVSKLVIKYQPVYNNKPSEYPWYIAICNGTGVAEQTATGGSAYKNFAESGKAFINVSNADLFRLMNAAAMTFQAFLYSDAFPFYASYRGEEEAELIAGREN